MQENLRGKKFRLLKPEMFSLEKNKLYLVVETPAGYVCRINEDEHMGFPKRIVERSTALFRPYDHGQQKTYNKFRSNKRHRVITLKRQEHV